MDSDFHSGEFLKTIVTIYGSSRKLVGIAIQHSDSEEEELFVHDSMQIRPEEWH